MSLEVAGLVDTVAPWPEWTETILSVINRALMGKKVSAGYNLMVTLAGRSYVFASDSSGKLTVTKPGPGMQTAKALKNAQARIVLETEAMRDFDAKKSGWDAQLMDSRMLRLEGDMEALDRFQGDVAPLISMLKSKVDREGPGQRAIDNAFGDYEMKFQMEMQTEKEKFDEELSLAMLRDTPSEEWWMPEFADMWGCNLFSTMSTMFGSVGQGNYNAANIILDVMTFQAKIFSAPGKYPVTHMWGGVGQVGMREKTFGSMDVLLSGAESMLLTPEQCMGVLWYLYIGVNCEWEASSLMDKDVIAWMNAPTTGPNRDPDPWGFGKGKKGASIQAQLFANLGGEGGGLSLNGVGAESKVQTGLFEGRRVRLHGLKSATEWNGKTGSLIKEVEEGKWQVRMDEDLGDKVLKVANLRTLTGASFTDDLPQLAAMTRDDYSVAGTWSNWFPKDMQWNDQEQCHMYDAEVDGGCSATFSFAKGKAGTKQWKNQRQEYQLCDNKGGVYRIKLFLKESGMFRNVDVQRLGDIKAAGPEGAVDKSKLTAGLRRILRESCPWWTESELAAVQEKLAKVNISTVSALLSIMKSDSSSLNKELEKAGEKGFNSKSVQAIKERVSQLS
mmetsp:Transcript_70978/g.123110  ORF Transcript_70978/g.123110 Transcript_70978/m.123110 type:complete len:615 (+) Transcript_70978:112-1956(+)